MVEDVLKGGLGGGECEGYRAAVSSSICNSVAAFLIKGDVFTSDATALSFRTQRSTASRAARPITSLPVWYRQKRIGLNRVKVTEDSNNYHAKEMVDNFPGNM